VSVQLTKNPREVHPPRTLAKRSPRRLVHWGAFGGAIEPVRVPRAVVCWPPHVSRQGERDGMVSHLFADPHWVCVTLQVQGRKTVP